MTTVFTVPSISCGHCTQTIEDRVSALADVVSVTADVDSKLVTVTGGTDDDVAAAIKAAGYEVTATASA